MRLQPWEWASLGIIGALAYVFVGGFAWALTPEDWNNPSNSNDPPMRHLVAIFWPVSLVGYIMYRIGMIGPRAVARWRERKKIPHAEIRQ